MIKINRLLNFTDANMIGRLELLYNRPRIDCGISEYVFEYINKNILQPNKIMQSGDYSICFSFGVYYKDTQIYITDSLYNTDTEHYDFHLCQTTEDGIKYKVIQLFYNSTQIDENLKPREYANIVYDMVGAFLIRKYKKITKEIMDKNKTGMDYAYIEKFKYPALFKDQKYLCDDNDNSRCLVTDDKGVEKYINEKEEYLKHYEEKI
jgi:hypothetical protein